MIALGTLIDSTSLREYLVIKLGQLESEVFACLWLNTKHELIEYEELFFGTIDGASVHPREVVKKALSHNAAAVVFAHNHPSGCNTPSQADIGLTQTLRKALSLVDVRALDHIIVGGGNATSLMERGIL